MEGPSACAPNGPGSIDRAVLDHMLEAFALHEVIRDEAGTPIDYRFLDANAAFEGITGIKRTDVIGRIVREVLPDVDARAAESYRRVALTGEPVRFRMHSAVSDRTYDVRAFRAGDGLIAAVFSDVTEAERTVRDLERDDVALRGKVTELADAMRTLSALTACNEALVRAESEPQLLQAICKIAVEQGGYLMTWVGYAEHDEEKSVRPVAFAGEGSRYLSDIRITWGEGPTAEGPGGTVIKTGSPMVIQSIADDPRFRPWRTEAVASKYRSLATLPLLLSDGTVLGAIMFYAGEPNRFEQRELSLLTELASDLTYGIEVLRSRNARAEMAEQLAASNVRLEAILHQVTVALGRVVESRDPYTAGHEERVAALSRQIACELGLSADDAEAVEVAALVHDIGKLSVPAEILTKPSTLSPVETDLVREHPQTGFNILKDIMFDWPIADIVLQHHERMDGSGYPNGISGEQILLPARILAVADTVEAMASHRPYRPALGLDAAIEEITSHPEKFDPQVAAACVRLSEAHRIDL
jgi:putative nucleotidyltransferase with HDIG domain